MSSQPSQLEKELKSDVERIIGDGGLLAEYLPGFEARKGQVEMAIAVERLLGGENSNDLGEHGNVLLIEAETGIGKTLAYLLPSLLSGQRIVISTATINLQDQILKKEIPLLAKVFGEKISALCLKGRQNYLCHYRWFQYRSSAQLSMFDDSQCENIDTWLDVTESGDRSELAWLSDRSSLWPKISAQSNQCLGAECPEASLCFVNRLRKKAGSARILIVNHHLFFSDLVLRRNGFGEILPRYEGIIFDEAHHLENVATTFFGRNFSHYQFLDLLSDIERQAESDLAPSVFKRVVSLTRGLKERVERFFTLFPDRLGRFHLKELITGIKNWEREVEELYNGIERLTGELFKHSKDGDIWELLETRANELGKSLLEIALPEYEGEEKNVHWYERRERTVALSLTPIKIAEELKNLLYPSVTSCVMTSATITTGDNFTYFRNRMGLDAAAVSLHLKSPFDYKGQTLLYVPKKDFPEPNAIDYSEKICEKVYQIIKISQGRALVLFTSFKGMDNMATYLEDKCDYPVLVQGTASRHLLLEQFKEETHSVLLAVASFWEGVDVPGESMSCVIIDKLPFEVPSDPVLQARMADISESGGKPFFDFQIPRAILGLRQGVGRLMRSSKDRGVIAIMDVRLYTKGYGRIFRASLPSSPVARSLGDIDNFFRSLN